MRAWIFTLSGLGILALAACSRGSQAGASVSPQANKLLAELPPPYNAADLENGRLHFSLCRACHTISKGGPDMTGPNLYGIFGRKAGSKPGYSYSDALKAADFTWDAAHLDRWLKSPQTYLPGTKMTFIGIKDDTDRRDLIGYLKVASSGGGD